MAGAIRLISIERGHDPKRFAAMPFGGGGALHAGALVREIGLAAAIVPRFPGVNSALGCVMSDLRHDEVRTLNRMLDALDCEELARMIDEITASSEEVIRRSKASIEGLHAIIELDMLYLGQTHAVAVPLAVTADGITTGTIRAAFDASYKRTYGRLLENIPVRVLNLRLSVIGRRPEVDIASLARGERAETVDDCHLADQRIFADGNGMMAPSSIDCGCRKGRLSGGPVSSCSRMRRSMSTRVWRHVSTDSATSSLRKRGRDVRR